MRNLRAPLYFLLVLFFVAGCAPSEPTVVQDKNNQFEMTLPPGWSLNTKNELHDEATLQASNPFLEKYAIVLTEDKKDLVELDIADRAAYSELTRSAFKDLKLDGPRELEIGGHPATQYTMRGKVDGYDVVYLHTIQETPDQYRQIMTWTMESKFDSYQDEMQQLIKSVKDLKTPQAADGSIPAAETPAPAETPTK